MISLKLLEAKFICLGGAAGPHGARTEWHVVETIEEAQGVQFLCPKCYIANNGSVETHHVICWSRSKGVNDAQSPGPGRWRMVGTSLDDLTLEADPPGIARSIALKGGCEWHGYVTNGEAG